MTIDQCSLVQLPKVSDSRGHLSFVEGQHHVPFEIKRIYYLYHIPTSAERGAHGHKNLQQLIIPVYGSFNITVDDGQDKHSFTLNNPSEGLYIPPMMWRELNDFMPNTVCLVLASDYYDEKDYFRDYPAFLRAIGK